MDLYSEFLRGSDFTISPYPPPSTPEGCSLPYCPTPSLPGIALRKGTESYMVKTPEVLEPYFFLQLTFERVGTVFRLIERR